MQGAGDSVSSERRQEEEAQEEEQHANFCVLQRWRQACPKPACFKNNLERVTVLCSRLLLGLFGVVSVRGVPGSVIPSPACAAPGVLLEVEQ